MRTTRKNILCTSCTDASLLTYSIRARKKNANGWQRCSTLHYNYTTWRHLTSSEKAKNARLKRIYKSSLTEHNALFAKQGGVCAICGKNKNKKGVAYVFSQDHDHKCCPRRLKEFCGKCNRGLLCYPCNKFVVGVLEKLGLDPYKVYAYLEYWNKVLKERGVTYEPKEAKPPRRKKAKLRKKQKSL